MPEDKKIEKNIAARSDDALTLEEVERMLKELPSCIFLKDKENAKKAMEAGRYRAA